MMFGISCNGFGYSLREEAFFLEMWGEMGILLKYKEFRLLNNEVTG